MKFVINNHLPKYEKHHDFKLFETKVLPYHTNICPEWIGNSTQQVAEQDIASLHFLKTFTTRIKQRLAGAYNSC